MYVLAVLPEQGTAAGGAPSTTHRAKRTRRPSTPAETARRKAWASEWGQVGREWKRRQLARKGKL